jgi:hypothetical protein
LQAEYARSEKSGGYNLMKRTPSLVLALAIFAAPALANVTVSSPTSDAELSSPFSLSATASPCSSQPIASMGYSIDSSTDTTVVVGASIGTQVNSPAGTHILHVKSWGNQGASCVTDVAILVVPASGAITTASSITVNAPAGGAELTSPFSLSANDSICGNLQVVSMGYSLDANLDAAVVEGQSIDLEVSATSGPHILHVKSWAPEHAACVVDLNITVKAATGSGAASIIPSDAISVSSLQSLNNWLEKHDPATGANSASTGSMSIVNSPSLSGFAREFSTSYTNSGGELYSVAFGDDVNATNFVYDGWVYLQGPSSGIANIEMDMNQVVANGDVVIYAFQCDGYSGTWDYSANSGTATNHQAEWKHAAGAPCNPRNWSTDTWHHVQVWYSRDDSGNVTYHSVWLDNVEEAINATVFSEFALKWDQILMINFQIDGLGASGSSKVYLDNMTVDRW